METYVVSTSVSYHTWDVVNGTIIYIVYIKLNYFWELIHIYISIHYKYINLNGQYWEDIGIMLSIVDKWQQPLNHKHP